MNPYPLPLWLFIVAATWGVSAAGDPGEPPKDPMRLSSDLADWPANWIDQEILQKLQQSGLEPNPPATKRELIRRAYFDLIGLPPRPDEVESFERDAEPDAFARVIDRLLADPAYGERWARHWLDVVRYAQTNGYERDGEKPNAWRYRDYVIRSFNEDKPYDRFILEQLAGDELDPVTDDAIIATGFYRLGVWDDEPDDSLMAEFEALDDVMMATGSTFLGLTISCARCHDHKFDPIPQSDYYKLLAFLRNVRPFANPVPTHDSATYVALGDRSEIARKFEVAKERSKALREELAKQTDAKEKKRLEGEIVRVEREVTAGLEWALAVRDGDLKPTHVLIRGNASSPGVEVSPGFLSMFGDTDPRITVPGHGESSGRRLALARWIAQPNHPLTARVMANRIWHHHFGRGLVQSTCDFGKSGTPPSHPGLLERLAGEFVRAGWSIKQLHRTMMMSKTYQMSSRVEVRLDDGDGRRDRAGSELDPGNDLLWRQNLRRLDAESIRDSMLAVSGALNRLPGGRGFFPYTAGEVLAAGSRPGDGWEISTHDQRARRTIYAFIKRSMIPPFAENFDYSNTAVPLGERPVTTVAPQALMLLNDLFVREQAETLAARIRSEAGDDAACQVQHAYRLAFGREPSDGELKTATEYMARQARAFAAIEHRLTFVPDVPLSLHRPYWNRLKPSEFLRGPDPGWTYYRGRWGSDYEGITTVDRACTPFAIWQGPESADAVVSAEVSLSTGTELASLLIRAVPDGDVFSGYEVVLDQREQRVAIRRHSQGTVTLAEIGSELRGGENYRVAVELLGGRLRVWLALNSNEQPAVPHGVPVLVADDPEPLVQAGRVGIRAWGGPVSFDRFVIELPDARIDLKNPRPVRPAARALESFCLVLLNLNEFIYVD